VDGYVVESLVADRGHTELICDAVGPDGGDATLVVAWRRPADRHSWPRIRRLARTRATLEHEALLPVLAVGEHSGRPYLATDRYPEATFANLLDEAPLSPERVLMLLAPVAEALDLAHASGLVHQSFSGTSLLVDGHMVLLDGFGVVGGPRELTVESAGVHEVRYCTPDELRGEALEPASNVYSLAALLVHALTGAPAYEGTFVAQAYGHLSEAPPRPSERRAELGVAFDDVIARGLAKDPADRPASASELLAEAATALGVDLPARSGS
jgi:serine/threonine protein kinase, bacterial